MTREIRPGVRRTMRLTTPPDAMDEEIALHVALRAEQLERDGLSPEAARAEAMRRFGPHAHAPLRESARWRDDRIRWRERLDGAVRGVRHALRALARTPLVTVVAVLSLALGIGANTAIFSIADRLLLRDVPVHAPESLVNLRAPGPRAGSDSYTQAGGPDALLSLPMARALVAATDSGRTAFAGLAVHRSFYLDASYDGNATNGEGLLVSGSYFRVLGLTPALGRLLGDADDVPNSTPAAVLSYAYWDATLGHDASVVGRTLLVNGAPLTIVGVAPPGFAGTTLGVRPSVFVPLTMTTRLVPWLSDIDDWRRYAVYAFARLAPGATRERAAAAINAIYRPLIEREERPYLESDAARERFRTKAIVLDDGRRGQTSLHAEVATPLGLLFGVTAIVLLIACANIANLLLVRGASRGAELAVRLSLGATRARIVTQLLTEACVLAVLGGVLGLAVARVTLGLIVAIVPAEKSGTLSTAIDLRVAAFAAAVSIATGLIFGTFPALHATRASLAQTIRANAGHVVGARAAARVRTALVTAQIALSMALLASAGLFLASLGNLDRVPLGLRVDHVTTFSIAPEFVGLTPAQSMPLFERVERELATIPGVTAVASGTVPILSGATNGAEVSVEGFTKRPDADAGTRIDGVSADYFHGMGMSLVAGRSITLADRAGAPKVAVVNEAFARKFGLGTHAVGARMAFGDHPLDIEIVGLVRDAKYADVKSPAPPTVFTPWRQDSTVGALTFYVRTSLAPETLLRSIPSVMRRVAPGVSVWFLKTLPQQARESVFLDRMIGSLSAAFAMLATVLAAVGLYGALAYTVAQRTREIGVRMALGASASRVRALVLRRVGAMLAVGGVLGLVGALAVGRAVRSLLYGLEAHDPRVLGTAAALLTIVALGAGWIPARRAARTAPVRALKYE